MTVGVLQDIMEKVRQLAGLGNTNQSTDQKIIKYINSYYLYDLPDDLRILKLKDVYTFNTIQGIDTYPFDFDSWSTVEGPAYCDKSQITLLQDPQQFYGYYFSVQRRESFATGDGTTGALTGLITAVTQATLAQVTSVNHGLTTGKVVTIQNVGGMVELNGNSYTVTVVDNDNFTLNVDSTGFTPYTVGGDWSSSAYQGTVSNLPFLRSVNNNPMADTQTNPTGVFPADYPPLFVDPNISRIQNILISANTVSSSLRVSDDGAGNLIGDCASGGTINYQTGVIAGLTFTASVPSGNAIEISYIPVNLAQPFAVLFRQEQFILQPVPDKAYTIEITAYREPSKALLGTTSSTAPDLSGRPEMWGWWELIAFGVAKKFYQDRLDMDGVQMMESFLQEQISQARTITYGQLGSRSISTIYRGESDQQENNGLRRW